MAAPLVFLASGAVQAVVLIRAKPFASARRSYLDYAHKRLVRAAKVPRKKGHNQDVVEISNHIKELRKTAGTGWHSADYPALMSVTRKLIAAKSQDKGEAIHKSVTSFCERLKKELQELERQSRASRQSAAA